MGDLDPSGLVRRQQSLGHRGAQPSLAGVCRVRAGLGERLPGRSTVEIDVLHADEPGAGCLRGGEDAGLQGGKLLRPPRVRRVEGLVDDPGAAGDGGGEPRVRGVATDHLDVVGYLGRPAAVHEPHRLAPAPQRVQRGQADGAGAEDDVPGVGVHALLSIRVRAGTRAAAGGGSAGSSACSSTPDSAAKTTAPLAPKTVTCLSTS